MSPGAFSFILGTGTVTFMLSCAVLIAVPPMSMVCAGAVLSTPSVIMTSLAAILWNVR